MRSASLLAAHVCRFYLDRGAWPAHLSDAVPPDARAVVFAPNAAEFGFRVVNGNPVLYSIGYGGHEIHGVPAASEQPTSEVVFFAVGRPND